MRGLEEGRWKDSGKASVDWSLRYPGALLRLGYPFGMFAFCCLVPSFLFLIFDYRDTQWRCLYVIVVIMASWIINYVDMVIVGFFPLLLAPVMGVMGFEEVMLKYVTTTTLLYVTASMVGGAFQAVGLDRRFAIYMMKGCSFQLYDVLWRYMVIAGGLSMFISDTATMTFLIPILGKMLTLMKECHAAMKRDGAHDPRVFKPPISNVSEEQFRGICFLVMAYSTCIGGMMTMIGATTNLVFVQNWEVEYGDQTALNFTTWFAYGSPIGLISLVCLWSCVVLSWEGLAMSKEIFVYLCRKFVYFVMRKDPNAHIVAVPAYERAVRVARNTIEASPPWSFAEKEVMALFCVLLVLLFTRNPGVSGFVGWHILFAPGFTDTAMPTTFIALLIVFLPKYNMVEVEQFVAAETWNAKSVRLEKLSTRLLSWEEAAKAVDWGVLWIFGGGFALAEMLKTTGLAATIAEALATLFKGMDTPVIVLITITFAAILTEFASATIVINIVTPILNKVATDLNLNPLLLSFNAVFACGSALLFPISSTSNVLAFKACNLSFKDSFRSGILYKVFSICIVFAAVYTIGYPLLDLEHFPEWAKKEVDAATNSSM